MNKFILTARMDGESQAYFDALRERHFPAERNFLRAHLTLFHALPESEMEQIDGLIAKTTAQHEAMNGSVSDLRSLGGGVAFVIECPQLAAIRNGFAKAWREFLSRQDRQGWRPHVTVQNKVSAEAARSLMGELRSDFRPRAIQFDGFDLWLYEGGPWSLAHSYLFAAVASADHQ